MNTPPRSPTPINPASYPSKYQQLIREKSQNFVGREFVFAAINEFLHRCDRKALPQGNRGYFTLLGALGSGKSAILGKYVKLWHLDRGEVIASVTGNSPLFCCAFAPDGVTIVAGDAIGRMHFLRWEGSR
jgi:hypothetical protein